MSGGLIHLAGQPIRVGSVIRQRCAWCGALIDEMDLALTAVPEGDPSPWPVDDAGSPAMRWAGLVAVEEHGPEHGVGMVARWAVDRDPLDDSIPEGSCMAMPTEATA